ncbi:3'-5' exonuclease family protein [Pseudomonas sp. S1_G07]
MARPSFFIDFEASGIAPDSYPIEVAVVSSDTTFSSLIKPARYWTHWSFDAQDMHGLSQDHLLEQGDLADVVARHMNQLFSGQVLCSDSPQDGFWLDVLYEAADLMPTFQLKPLEVLVGREAASDIYRLLPTTKHHRALHDATVLMNACHAFFKLEISKVCLPDIESDSSVP